MEAQIVEKDRVLVIDDDVKLCAMLRDYLTRHGWDVTSAHTGASGMEAARKVPTELVVLDLMLPDFDGFEVLRRLQREMNSHVLLLTARGEEIARIVIDSVFLALSGSFGFYRGCCQAAICCVTTVSALAQ